MPVPFSSAANEAASVFFNLWAQADPGGVLCFVVPFLVLWTGFVLLWFRHYYFTSPALVDRWAAENGFQIISKDRRTFFKGPFFWTSARFQLVYRISAEDARGRPRMGWVRIGSNWWPFSERIEVRWDPPPVPDDQRPTRGNPLMWDRDLDA